MFALPGARYHRVIPLLRVAAGLAAAPDAQVPRVLSMSLGRCERQASASALLWSLILCFSVCSLSFDSCEMLCTMVAAKGKYSKQQCDDYMQTQRQVELPLCWGSTLAFRPHFSGRDHFAGVHVHVGRRGGRHQRRLPPARNAVRRDLLPAWRARMVWLVARCSGVTLLAATGDGGSHFSFQPFSPFGIGTLARPSLVPSAVLQC